MSTIRLPCHKGLGRRPSPNTNSTTTTKTTKLRPGQIPYVSHDNGKTRYYADRYYIDAPAGLLEYQLDKRRNCSKVDYCDYCGERRDATAKDESYARPLFDRAAFINSLDLSAAIIATFTIGELEFLSETFPALFPRRGKEGVPTLVLHGHKGWKLPEKGSSVTAVEEDMSVDSGLLDDETYAKEVEQMNKLPNEGSSKVDSTKNNAESGCKPIDALEMLANDHKPELHQSLTNGKENMDSQSPPMYETQPPIYETDLAPSKDLHSSKRADRLHTPSKIKGIKLPKSAIKNEEEKAAVEQKPVLTYNGQTLEIKSTPRKRKRRNKSRSSSGQAVSPRRSPRLNRSSNSPNSAKHSLRRSSRLSPEKYKSPSNSQNSAGREEVVLRRSPQQKKESVNKARQLDTKVGTTPMDPICLDSDSDDDDDSNGNRITITSRVDEKDTRNKSASLDCKTETTKERSSCQMQTPPASPCNETLQKSYLLNPPPHHHVRLPFPDEKMAFVPRAPELSFSSHGHRTKRLKMAPAAPSEATIPAGSKMGPSAPSAATILARSFGSVPHAKLMKPVFQPSDAPYDTDSSFEDEFDGVNHAAEENRCNGGISSSKQSTRQNDVEHVPEKDSADNSKDVQSASAFGGKVYFTQVLPRWAPPKDYKSLKKCNKGKEVELEAVRGCHHPKFFLLFERRGSLVVIISTSNLTTQHALDASWVQRFESHANLKNESVDVDYGLTQDFGYVLTDLLKKQSEAAEKNGMLPDLFLSQFVQGLPSGLSDLTRRFKFEDSHVHLVSTVPGDYSAHLPKKGVASCYNRPPYRHPTITYGPQRVSYILSRIHDKHHIGVACATIPRGLDAVGGGGMSAVNQWLPPSLLARSERLVVQPTSMSGTWTREELEIVAKSYLEPYWNVDGELSNSPIELMDIVWPSMEHFDAMHEKRRALTEHHQKEAVVSKSKRKSTRGACHVFLSSVAFSKLDRACISRMALFDLSHQPHMPSYESASLHFKSYCRMLRLPVDMPIKHKKMANSTTSSHVEKCQSQSTSKEYISWFMLTSGCLSKGAQGQPTPYRSLESDSMSYSNFELGVLFCSRMLGDRVNDRLYVYDGDFSGGCQCGAGKRWYKDLLKMEIDESSKKPPAFLDSVRKVHLPIPYQLRPKSYQDDPESDFMSHTPYLHEIPPGTGDVGNMKLTPFGQEQARKNSSISHTMEGEHRSQQ